MKFRVSRLAQVGTEVSVTTMHLMYPDSDCHPDCVIPMHLIYPDCDNCPNKCGQAQDFPHTLWIL